MVLGIQMSTPEQIIKKYTLEHYGDLIVSDKPSFDEETKTWKAKLRSTYPRIVEDEISRKIIVGFLEFSDLGTIKMNEQCQVVNAPHNEDCVKSLSSKLDLWKAESEKIVIKASSDVLAEIAEGEHVLAPFGVIFDALTPMNNNEIKITDSDVYAQHKREKYILYLELLEELKIVRKIEGGYIQGQTYVGILDTIKTSDQRSLKTILFSHIIKEKYSTLRQVFGISQLEPFVHLANVYYSPSLEAEKLIHISKRHLYEQYQNNYRKITPLEFNSKLTALIDKNALQYEDGYVIGNEKCFNDMLKMKKSAQIYPILA